MLTYHVTTAIKLLKPSTTIREMQTNIEITHKVVILPTIVLTTPTVIFHQIIRSKIIITKLSVQFAMRRIAYTPVTNFVNYPLSSVERQLLMLDCASTALQKGMVQLPANQDFPAINVPNVITL